MDSQLEQLTMEILDPMGMESLSHFPNLILVVLTLLLMWVGKKVFDLLTPFNLEIQLVKEDNKAITIAFVGYLAGVAIILEGALQGDSKNLIQSIIDVSAWGIIGILLLNLSGKLNDLIILGAFSNREELLDKKNIAVGVVIAGSYLGSAMLIRSIILGESMGLLWDIGLTLCYFALAQGFFFLYSLLYRKSVRFDLLKEIQEGNIAAGISLGMNLVAVGILLAIPLRTSFSILLFIAWFVIGATAMAFFRFVMDRIIIPLEKLDEEIHKDQNWGVAFLEGSFSLAAVIIIQATFS